MEDETKGSCLAINFRGSSKRRDRDPDFEQRLSLLKDSEPAGFRLSAWTTSTVNSIEDDMLFPENSFYTEPVPTTVTPENQVKRPSSSGRRRRSSVYQGEQEPPGVRGQEAAITPESLLKPPTASGGSLRRRSSVYQGEQEPPGVRGQEAIVTPVNKDPPSSAARRYRESLLREPDGRRGDEATTTPESLLKLPSASGGSRRRRSPVYEGELEPQGVRGQEARVQESGSSRSKGIPGMRTFSPNEQAQSDGALRFFSDEETSPSMRRRDTPLKVSAEHQEHNDAVRQSYLDLLPVTETSIPEEEEDTQSSESSDDSQPMMRGFASPGDMQPVMRGFESPKGDEIMGQLRSPESARNPRRLREPMSYGSQALPPQQAESSSRQPSMRSSIDSVPTPISGRSSDYSSSADSGRKPSMRSSIDSSKKSAQSRTVDMASGSTEDLRQMMPDLIPNSGPSGSRRGIIRETSSTEISVVSLDNLVSQQRRSTPVNIDDGEYVDAAHDVEGMNAAAVEHVDKGEYDKALAAFEQVLEAYREMYGESHPLVASTYHNLGMVHSKRAALLLDGTFHQSHCRQQSLECFQAAARTGRDSLGRNHPNVAVSLVRIGFLLLQARQYQNAFVTFKEALRIRVEHYGTDVPNSLIANLYNNLGVCKMHLGQYKEGSSLLATALDIQRKVLRRKRQEEQISRGELRNCLLEVADTLCNLGGLYLEWIRHQGPDLRHSEQAEAAFAEALEIRTTVLGSSHALVHQVKTLHEMARAAPVPAPTPNPKRRPYAPRTDESFENIKPDPVQETRELPTVGSPELGYRDELLVNKAVSPVERAPPSGAGRRKLNISSVESAPPSGVGRRNLNIPPVEHASSPDVRRRSSARTSSLPVVEITMEPEQMGDSDSFENGIAPSNSADTKIRQAPHHIPRTTTPVEPQNQNVSIQSDAAEFNPPSMQDSSASETSSTSPIQLLKGLRDLSLASAGGDGRRRPYVNYAEESCMMSDTGGDISSRATALFNSVLEREESFTVENSRTLSSHEIMIVRPDDSFAREVPPGSKQTASWSGAVGNGGVKQNGKPYYDSPTVKLKEDDGMYAVSPENSREEYSMVEENEDGLAPLGGNWATSDELMNGLTRDILENPAEHLGQIYDAARRYLQRKQYPEALHLFQTIVDCQRQLHGELDADVGSAYHNVGVAFLRAERHSKALDAFEKAVRVRKGALGQDHPEVAVSLVKVGISQLLLHNFEMALFAFRDALSIRRHSLGVLHPSTARVYNNIGCVHIEFNELRDARRAFEAALDIQRNALCDEPTSGPLLFGAATTLCNLGYLYKHRGMPERAALVLTEALSIQEHILGPNHQTVLSTMDSLAEASLHSGNGLLALRYYGEILDRFHETFQGDDYTQRLGTEAILLYKMSQADHQLNDLESELEKLKMALEAIRSVDRESMTVEDLDQIDRLDDLMLADIQRVQSEMEKAQRNWL